jgi:hypothetical protein
LRRSLQAETGMPKTKRMIQAVLPPDVPKI